MLMCDVNALSFREDAEGEEAAEARKRADAFRRRGEPFRVVLSSQEDGTSNDVDDSRHLSSNMNDDVLGDHTLLQEMMDPRFSSTIVTVLSPPYVECKQQHELPSKSEKIRGRLHTFISDHATTTQMIEQERTVTEERSGNDTSRRTEMSYWQYLSPKPLTSRDSRFKWPGTRTFACLRHNLLADWQNPCAVGREAYNPLQYISAGRGRDDFREPRMSPAGFATILRVSQGCIELVMIHREEAKNISKMVDAGIESLANVLRARESKAFDSDPSANGTYAPSMAAMTRRVWRCELRSGDVLFMPSGTIYAYRYAGDEEVVVGDSMDGKKDRLTLLTTRFHLDTLNAPRLFQSFVDQRTVGIAHRQMVWNAAHGAMVRAQNAIKRWRKYRRKKKKIWDRSVTLDPYVHDELLRLKHVAQAYANTHVGDTTFWDWRLLISDIESTSRYVEAVFRTVRSGDNADGGENGAKKCKSRAPRLRTDPVKVTKFSVDISSVPKHLMRISPPQQLQHQYGRRSSGASRKDSQEMYRARNNETPKMIAKKFFVDIDALVRVNMQRFPGLSASSRLQPGTEVVIPTCSSFLSKFSASHPESAAIASKGQCNDSINNIESEICVSQSVYPTQPLTTTSYKSVNEMPSTTRKRDDMMLESKIGKSGICEASSNVDDSMQQRVTEASNTYRTRDNETPQMVAEHLGIDTNVLMELNRKRYRGLRARSRLMEGTELLLPPGWSVTSLWGGMGFGVSRENATSSSTRRRKKTARKSSLESQARFHIENPIDFDRAQLSIAKSRISDNVVDENEESADILIAESNKSMTSRDPKWNKRKLLDLAERALSESVARKGKKRKKKKRRRKRTRLIEGKIVVNKSASIRSSDSKQRQSKRLSSDWSCSRCSLRNLARHSKCAVCNTPRSFRGGNGKDVVVGKTSVFASDGAVVSEKSIVKVRWRRDKEHRMKDARVLQVLSTAVAIKVRYEEWNDPKYDDYHPLFCVTSKSGRGQQHMSLTSAPPVDSAVYVRPAGGSESGVHAYGARVVSAYHGPLVLVRYHQDPTSQWDQWLPPEDIIGVSCGSSGAL